MFTGQPAILYRKAQTLLPAWISVIVMINEQDPATFVAIDQADRAWIYKHRKPPGHWRIWIGNYLGDHYHPMILHVPLILTEGEIPYDIDFNVLARNTQNTTFCVGSIFVHAMSSSIRTVDVLFA